MGAGGADIWGTSDEFRFAYKQLSGDGSITVRVDSLVRSDGWAKAGVMIRQNVNATAVNAGIFVTPDNGVSFQYRATAGGDSANTAVADLVAPYWVKLIRTGNVFAAQYSADGTTWTNLETTSPVELDMTGSVLVGLAVTSHNSAVMTNAEMSNVATTGGVTGAWQVLEVGVDQPGNAADSLYVAVKDAAGNIAAVVHPEPAATIATAWQQWQIPFSDFVGVNMARVQTMYVGIGDRNNAPRRRHGPGVHRRYRFRPSGRVLSRIALRSTTVALIGMPGVSAGCFLLEAARPIVVQIEVDRPEIRCSRRIRSRREGAVGRRTASAGTSAMCPFRALGRERRSQGAQSSHHLLKVKQGAKCVFTLCSHALPGMVARAVERCVLIGVRGSECNPDAWLGCG